MTPKEFITKELGNFIQNFPQVRVRYEFHAMSNAHFVEIVPNEVYNLNEDYISWEVDMWNRFVKLFPEEGICFISDDALVGIENVELTLYGANYAPVSEIQENVVFDAVFNTESYTICKGTVSPVTKKEYIVEDVQMPCLSQTYLLAA